MGDWITISCAESTVRWERDHRNSGCGGKSRQPNKWLPGPLDEGPMGKPVANPKDLLYSSEDNSMEWVGGSKIWLERETFVRRIEKRWQKVMCQRITRWRSHGLLFPCLRKVSHDYSRAWRTLSDIEYKYIGILCLGEEWAVQWVLPNSWTKVWWWSQKANPQTSLYNDLRK